MKYSLRYLFICERDPKIKLQNIPTEFIYYNQKTIAYDALKGDLFLAPRDLHDAYNLGHSFTKIGIPMALGIPVVASPIPSYEGSPAILLNSNDACWYDTIEELLLDPKRCTQLSLEGRNYCKKHFSSEVIVLMYKELFGRILNVKD